jgi:hypothetical protein
LGGTAVMPAGSAALLAVCLSAAPPGVSPGAYILKGGSGTLEVERSGHFKIEVVGANAHTCELEGQLVSGVGRIVEEGSADVCEVHVDAAQGGWNVSTQTESACRVWCGARAWFEGVYLKPAPECEETKVAASRKEASAAYKKRDYARTREVLAGLLTRCEPVLDRFTLMWLRNDAAIASHHLQDDAGCRRLLEPLQQLVTTPDEDVGAGEPSFQDEWLKIARATRTNAKLCAPPAGQGSAADRSVSP